MTCEDREALQDTLARSYGGHDDEGRMTADAYEKEYVAQRAYERSEELLDAARMDEEDSRYGTDTAEGMSADRYEDLIDAMREDNAGWEDIGITDKDEVTCPNCGRLVSVSVIEDNGHCGECNELAESSDEDDDPRCVCGVYRSEHALCGCREGFQSPKSWNAERDMIRGMSDDAYDNYSEYLYESRGF